MIKKWKPSNEPTDYDEVRVAQLKPIEVEIKKLGLPLVRFQKLNGILGALEMQIEDGGDNPQINALLLEALREGAKHQVGKREAAAVLRSINIFHGKEIRHWKQVKAGNLPPSELMMKEQLDDLMQEGHKSLDCDLWLEAWEIVKQMTMPQMRTARAFDKAYPGLTQFVSNWCSDLEMELHNFGLRDPTYHEHRLRYTREFLAQFPDEDANRYVNFMRAQGEALWNLERRAEAEEVYENLVERLPDEAWGYIGWADHYWLWKSSEPKEYERAEAILQRALARPNLQDRDDVLERLEMLYEEWGKPKEQASDTTEPINPVPKREKRRRRKSKR